MAYRPKPWMTGSPHKVNQKVSELKFVRPFLVEGWKWFLQVWAELI
jgi:hypothetical protein